MRTRPYQNKVPAFTCLAALVSLCVPIHAQSTAQIRPPEAPEMKGQSIAAIRADGTLLINGRPIFPIGLRIEGEGKEHKLIADAGFNMLLGSGKVEAPYYEAATRNKLWVIAGHYVWATFATIRSGNSREVDLYAEEDKGLQKTFGYWNQSRRKPLKALADFDHYPCVFAWNTCEEPPAKFVEPLEQMYEIFKSNSPHHLVAALSCDIDWAYVFRKAGDLLILDCYPYRGHRSQPAIYTYQRVRRAREALGNRPVWLMPQLYQPFYWSRRDDEELTVQQMREQCYLGLIAGAKGIVMYHYYALWQWCKDGHLHKTDADPALFEARWERVRKVVAELRKLGPLICDGRPVELPLQWFGPGGQALGPQLTRTLDYYGDLYLLVVNLADHAISARAQWTNPANRDAHTVAAWLGDDDLRVDNAKPAKSPTLSVKAKGSGVFLLKRRPLQPKPPKGK